MSEVKAANRPDASVRDISLGITLALGAFATFFLISAIYALLALVFAYGVARGLPVSTVRIVLPLLTLCSLAAKVGVLYWFVRRAPARLSGERGGAWPTTLAVLGGLSVFISMGASTFTPFILARLAKPIVLAHWSITMTVVSAVSRLAHGALVIGFLIYVAQQWSTLASKGHGAHEV